MRTGHCLIVGQTESGKSTLAKRLARAYQRQGTSVAVLDPLRDPGWQQPGCAGFWMTNNADEFLATATDPDKCLSCALFIDETGLAVGKYNSDFDRLTTTGRQFGLVVHLVAQRAEMVSVNLRSQCRTLFAFNISETDAKKYAQDFNSPLVLQCPNLAQGEFIYAARYAPSRRLRLW